MNNLISTEAYAEMCHVSTTTIRNRIALGMIKAVKTKNGYYIDAQKYPPQRAGSAGRPKAAKMITA